MENAKHIGGIWALAVALGMGMAVANSPAVASADSGKGSSAGSSSSSSHDSGGTSSAKPSAKTATSAPNDPASRHPKPHDAVNSSRGTDTGSGSSTGAATTAAAEDVPDTDARRRDGDTSRPGSGPTSAKKGPKSAVVDAPAADTSLDVAPTTPSLAATPVAADTARTSTAITPNLADPVSHLVSRVIDAVLSPFATSAPTAPVQSPAEWTLLAFARREFEQAITPATAVASPAADKDFISSTHDLLGLFSVTSAADPDDNNYVAFVLETPFFTNVLTSGTDPEDNLGFGAASIGLPGQTVNTFISPFVTFSIAIPVTDPFAPIFTELVRLGF
jgi:hypothetical protein